MFKVLQREMFCNISEIQRKCLFKMNVVFDQYA